MGKRECEGERGRNAGSSHEGAAGWRAVGPAAGSAQRPGLGREAVRVESEDKLFTGERAAKGRSCKCQCVLIKSQTLRGGKQDHRGQC